MGMFKNFALKHLLKHKMKDVPEAQRDQIMGLMEKNPDLFKKIGEEVKQRVKAGDTETAASMVVMRKYQGELQKLARR